MAQEVVKLDNYTSEQVEEAWRVTFSLVVTAGDFFNCDEAIYYLGLLTILTEELNHRAFVIPVALPEESLVRAKANSSIYLN